MPRWRMLFAELARRAAALERWLPPGQLPALPGAGRARRLPDLRPLPEPLAPDRPSRCATDAASPGISTCPVGSAASGPRRWPGSEAPSGWTHPPGGRCTQLKYEGWWRVAEPMAARHAGRPACGGDWVLVPVPLTAAGDSGAGATTRRRCWPRRWPILPGFRWRSDLLRRVRETPTQTALTPQARAANVAGAFQAGPLFRAAGRPGGRRLHDRGHPGGCRARPWPRVEPGPWTR